jgi:hypothetical protein
MCGRDCWLARAGTVAQLATARLASLNFPLSFYAIQHQRPAIGMFFCCRHDLGLGICWLTEAARIPCRGV